MNFEEKTEEEILNILHIHNPKLKSNKNKPKKWFFITAASTIFLAALLVLLFTFNFYLPQKKDPKNPAGAILSPVQGSTTGNTVRVQGKTQNIEPGKYIWLVVDKPALQLCWPKIHCPEPNCSFMATIKENGSREAYVLSLYAVNERTHKYFTEWREHKVFGGLPMLPESRRLDSIELTLST